MFHVYAKLVFPYRIELMTASKFLEYLKNILSGYIEMLIAKFHKIDVLKNIVKFRGKHLRWHFLVNLQAWSDAFKK